MRHALTARAIRWSGPVLGLAISVVAHAQSSTNFKMLTAPGFAGGRDTSASYRLQFEVTGQTIGRGSATNTDAVAGFIGGVYSPQATISLQTTGNAYSSLAIPLKMSNPAATSVFGSLGGPDNTRWRLGHWSPADSSYMEVGGGLPLNKVGVGLGYWLTTDVNQTVSVTGLPLNTDPNSFYVDTLFNGPGGRPAWNQLGNPFLFPIQVSDIFVFDGAFHTLLDPGNLATTQLVKVRTGSSYTDVTTFVNGRTAFWIKKLEAVPVQLIFPSLASRIGGTPQPARVKPAGADWAVAVNGSQGERVSETLWLGTAPVAAVGWNPMSIPRGPEPPGGPDLCLAVRRSDWGIMSDDYVRDFEPPSQSLGWNIQVSGAGGPGEVRLDFSAFDLPAGSRLWLSDPAAGWTREVKSGGAATVAVGSGGKTLRFEVRPATLDLATAPQGDAFHVAYPNPFRSTTGLSFSLARGGDVAVDIFDVQGRLIRSLDRRGLAAGDHVIVWDGRDAGGRDVARGIYLSRWRAGAAAGVTRVAKID